MESEEAKEEPIQYTPPQENQSQQTPGIPSLPSSPFTTIKWIFYGIVGFICILGIINVLIQFFQPKSQATPSTQTANTTLASSEWKTFNNTRYGYSVSYPSSLHSSDETPYSTAFLAQNPYPNKLQFPTLYISVIPDGMTDASKVYNFMSPDILQKVYAAQDGDTIPTLNGIGAEYWNFKKLATIPVVGIDAVVIENHNVQDGPGIANRRIILKNKNMTYILGSFFSTQDELDTFRKFVESFQVK